MVNPIADNDDLYAIRTVMAEYELFDNALLYHNYARYMRDYNLIVDYHIGPAAKGVYKFVFEYCVECHVQTNVRPDVYRKSLDDQLTNYELGKDLNGFVWGTGWSTLYPGWKLIEDSPQSIVWTNAIGITFFEISIETEAYSINLIFHSLRVEKLADANDPAIESATKPLR